MQQELNQSAIQPLFTDRERLSQAIELTLINEKNKRIKKLNILRAAAEKDACLEAECYVLVN